MIHFQFTTCNFYLISQYLSQLISNTSCLHRHVGAPTGWYPNVVSLFVIFWIFWSKNVVSLFVIFWIFWSKMKITQADTPIICMDYHPIQTNWCPHLYHSHLPGTTLPIYPGSGQAPNMLACIAGGFLHTHFCTTDIIKLLPTPLPQTPHSHLVAFCISLWHSPLIIYFVSFIFTLMPLFFHVILPLIKSFN